ncbi:MAG: sigma-70 family RNA polymerase sigma factor [Bacteroidales bacterium]
MNCLEKVSDKSISSDFYVFRELYVVLFSRLTKYAYKIVHDNEMSHDIVQNVFLNYWNNRSKLTIHSDQRSYLYGMVKNEAINQMRKRKMEKDKIVDYWLREKEIQSEFNSVKDEVFVDLYKAIDKLPEKCRYVLFMTLKEHSIASIEESLNISQNTVKTHRRRAYAFLRKALVRC